MRIIAITGILILSLTSFIIILNILPVYSKNIETPYNRSVVMRVERIIQLDINSNEAKIENVYQMTNYNPFSAPGLIGFSEEINAESSEIDNPIFYDNEKNELLLHKEPTSDKVRLTTDPFEVVIPPEGVKRNYLEYIWKNFIEKEDTRCWVYRHGLQFDLHR